MIWIVLFCLLISFVYTCVLYETNTDLNTIVYWMDRNSLQSDSVLCARMYNAKYPFVFPCKPGWVEKSNYVLSNQSIPMVVDEAGTAVLYHLLMDSSSIGSPSFASSAGTVQVPRLFEECSPWYYVYTGRRLQWAAATTEYTSWWKCPSSVRMFLVLQGKIELQLLTTSLAESDRIEWDARIHEYRVHRTADEQEKRISLELSALENNSFVLPAHWTYRWRSLTESSTVLLQDGSTVLNASMQWTEQVYQQGTAWWAPVVGDRGVGDPAKIRWPDDSVHVSPVILENIEENIAQSTISIHPEETNSPVDVVSNPCAESVVDASQIDL